jgi:hypothetical protein
MSNAIRRKAPVKPVHPVQPVRPPYDPMTPPIARKKKGSDSGYDMIDDIMRQQGQ